MNPFPAVSTWHVPKRLLDESLAEMSLDGENGNEGICLWLGIRHDRERIATISHLVKLRGTGIRKSPANIQIAPELMREVHHAAMELNLILVGQVHSHGKLYGVDLSPVDIRYGVSVPYYLSVVAPDYAMNPHTQWEECGVHVFFPERGYVRVGASDVLSMESALSLRVLTVSQ